MSFSDLSGLIVACEWLSIAPLCAGVGGCMGVFGVCIHCISCYATLQLLFLHIHIIAKGGIGNFTGAFERERERERWGETQRQTRRFFFGSIDDTYLTTTMTYF